MKKFSKNFEILFNKWLAESDPFVLNEDEYNQLLESIRNPPAPTEKLKQAMREFKEANR
jgi:uncharacterized protein (DUF1778 family)